MGQPLLPATPEQKEKFWAAFERARILAPVKLEPGYALSDNLRDYEVNSIDIVHIVHELESEINARAGGEKHSLMEEHNYHELLTFADLESNFASYF